MDQIHEFHFQTFLTKFITTNRDRITLDNSHRNEIEKKTELLSRIPLFRTEHPNAPVNVD